MRAAILGFLCIAAVTACSGDRDLRLTRQERVEHQLERQGQTDEIIREQRRLSLPSR